MVRIGGELACWGGRIAQGKQRLSLRAMHVPRPPIYSPLPRLKVGRPGRRLVPGVGGVRGGLILGGGRE